MIWRRQSYRRGWWAMPGHISRCCFNNENQSPSGFCHKPSIQSRICPFNIIELQHQLTKLGPQGSFGHGQVRFHTRMSHANLHGSMPLELEFLEFFLESPKIGSQPMYSQGMDTGGAQIQPQFVTCRAIVPQMGLYTSLNFCHNLLSLKTDGSTNK